MRVKIKNGVVPLSELHSVLDAGTGVLSTLDESKMKRLVDLRLQALPIQASDIPLMESGFIDWAVNVEANAEHHRQDIEENLKSVGALCIMPTEKCNFRCTYCYETFLKGKMQTDVQDAIIRFLNHEVPKFRLYNLGWFGGEPLLHPDIVIRMSAAFRRIALEANVATTVAITTNGSLLKPELVQQLNAVGVDLYHITVDGPKNLHEAKRRSFDQGGTYERILDNIEYVLKNASSQILLRVNLDTREPEEVRQVRDWLTDTIVPRFSPYAGRVDFHPVSIWDASTSGIDGLCISEFSRFQEWISIKVVVEKALGRDMLAEFAGQLSSTGSYACYAGRPNHYIIGSDGKAYKCTVAFDLPLNNIGAINSEGELNVDAERELAWTGANSLNDPQCQKCHFAQACMGIHCPLVRIQTNRPPCPTEKLHLTDYIRIASGISETERQLPPVSSCAT